MRVTALGRASLLFVIGLFFCVSTTIAAGPTSLATGAYATVGDAVSDLDLSKVVYAVDSGAGVDRTIAGVTFEGSEAGPIAGYTQAVAAPTLLWGAYNIGATADENNLEDLLADIQCCDTTTSIANYDFAVPNGHYKVQLLWGEKEGNNVGVGNNDNTRPWDVRIEGLTTDEINVQGLLAASTVHVHPDAGSFDFDGDGSILDQFLIYNHAVDVTDGVIDIDIAGLIVGGQVDQDRNFVLSGIIINAPEPSTMALVGGGLITLLAWRRRQRRRAAV